MLCAKRRRRSVNDPLQKLQIRRAREGPLAAEGEDSRAERIQHGEVLRSVPSSRQKKYARAQKNERCPAPEPPQVRRR